MNTDKIFDHIVEQTIEDRMSHLTDLILSDIMLDDSLQKCWLRQECLLDALILLYVECEKQGKYNEHCEKFATEIHDTISQLCCTRINIIDFENLLMTEKGDFGSLSIVREKGSNTMYTMKTLRKDYVKKHIEYSYMTERDLMVCSSSAWIPSMKYTFQDNDNLYFVMDHLPGCNLLMIRNKHSGRLDETVVQFYVSEMVLALQYIHSLGYVYRDMRPINVLLDEKGHVKLSNFGFASKAGENIVITHTMVGLEEYVPPEVLESTVIYCPASCMVSHKTICNIEYDYWALGIFTYELLFGFTPFGENTAYLTYKNILNYKHQLKFPHITETLSDKCIDFLKSLLVDSQIRLRQDEILKHSFFDFKLNMFDNETPYIPDLDSFENINYSDIKHNSSLFPSKSLLKTEMPHFLPFFGFAYVRKNTCSEDEVFYSPSSSLKQRIVDITEEKNKFECDFHKMSSVAKNLEVMLVKEQEDRKCTEDMACSIVEDFKSKLEVQYKQENCKLKDKINYLENELNITQKNTYQIQKSTAKGSLSDITSIIQVLNDMKNLTKEFENRFIDARENGEGQAKRTDVQIKCRRRNDSNESRFLGTSEEKCEQYNLTAVSSSIESEMEKLKLFISLTRSEEKAQKEAVKKDLMENLEKSKECVETLEKENIELLNQLKIQKTLCEKQKSELLDMKERYLDAEKKVENIQKQAELQIVSYSQELLEVKRQLKTAEAKLKEHLQICTMKETDIGYNSDIIIEDKNESKSSNVEEKLQKEIDILKKALEDTRLCSKHHNEELECLNNMFKCKQTELLCAKKRTKLLEEQLEEVSKTSETPDQCPYGCKKGIHKLESELNFLKEAACILEQQVEDYEKVAISMQDCINKLCSQRDELMSRVYTCSSGKVYVQELLLKQDASVFLDDEVSRLKTMIKRMDDIKAKTSENKE